MHELRDLTRGQAFSWCQDFRTVETRTSAKSVQILQPPQFQTAPSAVRAKLWWPAADTATTRLGLLWQQLVMQVAVAQLAPGSTQPHGPSFTQHRMSTGPSQRERTRTRRSLGRSRRRADGGAHGEGIAFYLAETGSAHAQFKRLRRCRFSGELVRWRIHEGWSPALRQARLMFRLNACTCSQHSNEP